MSSKTQVESRLDRLRPLPRTLPTARLSVGRPVGRSARSVSGGLDIGPAAGFGFAREIEAMQTGYALTPANELMSDPALAGQVAGLARAGLFLVNVSEAFAEGSLATRSAMGGNGSVTRVLLDGERILLETPRLVVAFTAKTSAKARLALLDKHRLYVVRELRFLPAVIATTLDGNASDVCRALLEEKGIAFAEPDFVEHIDRRELPGDPLIGMQWHLKNNSQTGGAAGADIGAEAAWATTRGAGSRIAVIDNGFSVLHPDLAFGKWSGWYRPTADRIDADFINKLDSMPDEDHGTACAGMAAAIADNNVGGAGVACDAELTAIACLNDQVGTQTTLARAIAYAASPALEAPAATPADGADVIVCSLGPNGAEWQLSETLREAIDFVAAEGRGGKGAPLLWACTNGNFPIAADRVVSHPRVIPIGRSTHADEDDGSGFGPELDLLAPGVRVHIPSSDGRYQTTTGTSFAAPCAAGVAALVLATNPALTAVQVRKLLRDTADKVGPLPYVAGRNDRFGYGRVNAAKAVAAA